MSQARCEPQLLSDHIESWGSPFANFCVTGPGLNGWGQTRAVIVVMLPAMNETLLTYWFGVTGLIVAQLAKTVIFAVLSAYLLALAWAILASFLMTLNTNRRPHCGCA